MSNNGRFTVKVRADETLAGDSVVGSIHQVGAKRGLRVVMGDLLVFQTGW